MPPDRHSAATIATREAESRHPTHEQHPRVQQVPAVPEQVRRIVPPCAQSCIATYISQEYNCPYNEFTCLCSRYSSEGFTLGELAYICLRQECEREPRIVSIDVYNICSANTQAVQPTHATLTPPATSHTSTTAATTNTRHRTTAVLTSHKTAASTARTSHRSQDTSTHHTTTRSTATVSTAASKTKAPPAMGESTSMPTPIGASQSGRVTKLTSAEAAGISIAAMGAIMLAIAAVYLIVCFRRRKVKQQEKRKSWDFVDDEPPRFSPFKYGYADPRGPLGGFHKTRAELMTEKRKSGWQRNPSNTEPVLESYEKEVDTSPQSQRSDGSMRTVSQLLPDKPDPVPIRTRTRSLTASATTMFEEDRIPSFPLPPSNSRGLPNHPRAVYHPPKKRVQPAPSARNYSRPPEIARHPALSLEIPRQATRSSGTFSGLEPPKLDHLDVDNRDSTASKTPSRLSAASVLNYYASPDAGNNASPEFNSPTPIEDEIQKRKPAPSAISVSKPKFPPQAFRQSAASDTSFESMGPDEPTPPEEEEKQLTPVEESPMISDSPIAGIRYPKIPRPSNQAVPRSPLPNRSPQKARLPESYLKDDRTKLSPHNVGRPRASPRAPAYSPDQKDIPEGNWSMYVTPKRQATSSSTLSGSTLAAKRRGDSIAQELELSLKFGEYSQYNSPSIESSRTNRSGRSPPRRAPRQESPLKGYGRVTSTSRKAQQDLSTPPHLWRSDGQSYEAHNSPAHLWRGPVPVSEPQQVVVRSPRWDPKLTPSRRGDDLYLQVGVATPSTAGFTPKYSSFVR